MQQLMNIWESVCCLKAHHTALCTKKDLQTAYTEMLKILGRKTFKQKLFQLFEFHSVELS